MREDLKGTLIIISHQERILRIADEIVILADGTVHKSGEREDMIRHMRSGTVLKAACWKQEELFDE